MEPDYEDFEFTEAEDAALPVGLAAFYLLADAYEEQIDDYLRDED